MAPSKKIIRGSSSRSVSARRNNVNMQRHNLNDANLQTESAHRQRILELVSENLINPQFARLAWFQSIERDLQQLRADLQALERATFGESKSGNGKNQLNRKAKGP